MLALVGWLMFSGVGMLLALAILKVGGDKRALAAVVTTILVFLVIALFNPHMYARYWTMPILLCFGLGLTQLRGAGSTKVQMRNHASDVPSNGRRLQPRTFRSRFLLAVPRNPGYCQDRDAPRF